MSYRVWYCKLVVNDDKPFPEGFDAPPRRAAITAVEQRGIEVVDCFSGWGASLTKDQKGIVDRTMKQKATLKKEKV
jgi:hypothetical protein